MWVFFRLLPAPRGFVLLTVTGRKTGKRRRRPIRALRDGSIYYGVAILGERSDWLKNLRANPRAQARIGTRTRAITMREVSDAGERAKAVKLYVETVVPYDFVDVPLVEWAWPSPGRIRKAHQDWVERGRLVALEVDQP
jgi:deazaflavin-dependent oxidoreductase (nitroreductase family)